MTFFGKVVRELVAKGSKSERLAVMLDTGVERHVLRRAGGNPFNDAALNELVGKSIVAEGTLHNGTLIMSSWRENDNGKQKTVKND